jgi:hypothetical protein
VISWNVFLGKLLAEELADELVLVEVLVVEDVLVVEVEDVLIVEVEDVLVELGELELLPGTH